MTDTTRVRTDISNKRLKERCLYFATVQGC